MNKLHLTLAIWLVSASLYAQSIDEKRMTRDIEITENILQTLIKQAYQDDETFKWNSYYQVKGSYLNDYGVMFELPARLSEKAASVSQVIINDKGFNLVIDGEQFELSNEDIEKIKLSGKNIIIKNQGVNIEINENDLKALSDHQEINTIKQKLNIGKLEKLIEVEKDFLIEYGDLIGQLKPEQFITVSIESEIECWSCQEKNQSKVMVSIKKEDLTEYKQGKIEKQQLLDRIKVINSTSESEEYKDLEIFVSIMERVYKSDLAETYFMSRQMKYDILPGMGIIFSGRLYSSFQENNHYSIPSLGLEKLSKSERNDKIKSIYPQFVDELKENVLQYGRTIKTLKPKESMVFKLKMTECEGCGIPQDITVTVPHSVLSGYAQGKLDLQKAIAQISLDKGEDQ